MAKLLVKGNILLVSIMNERPIVNELGLQNEKYGNLSGIIDTLEDTAWC